MTMNELFDYYEIRILVIERVSSPTLTFILRHFTPITVMNIDH